eukprot:GGOE01040953.1.p1 GENE.GGOE01040953.1~~GGOE01040953.1.p1  ORF type:complete len:511 (+),score=136.32 GGOE01040953.1:102-1634(+)
MRQQSPHPAVWPLEGLSNGGFSATAIQSVNDVPEPGKGSRPVASQVVLQSLETENELLKSELRAQTSFVAELQTRFAALDGQRHSRPPSRCQCRDALSELETRIVEVQGELQRKEELVAHLTQQVAAMQDEAGKAHTTAQEQAQAAHHGSQVLRWMCCCTSQCLGQWLTFIEELLLQVLPTFRTMVAPEGGYSLQTLLQTYALDAPIAQLPALPPACTAVCASEEQRVVELLRSMDGALAMLQQVVFARLETMLVLRTKVTDDNTRLQRELEASAADRQRSQAELSAIRQEAEAERAAMRRDIGELQELYRLQLARVEEQRQGAVQRAEAAEAEMKDFVARCESLQGALERSTAQRREAERRLGAEETTRARLIVEMQSLKKEGDLRAEELTSLRAQQKLLALQGSSGAISKPECHLVRIMEQLLAENEALRVKHAQLTVDVAMATDQAAQAKYLSADSREDREIGLIVERRVPDTALTARILQRNLHLAGPIPDASTTASAFPALSRPT